MKYKNKTHVNKYQETTTQTRNGYVEDRRGTTHLAQRKKPDTSLGREQVKVGPDDNETHSRSH